MNNTEITLEEIISNINNYIPFIYVKLGDGEYIAANKYSNDNSNNINGVNGLDINSLKENCDGVVYTINLKNNLIDSCKYLLKLPNCYVGKWYGLHNFFENLVNNQVNWTNYQMFIITDKEELKNNLKFNLYKSIKLAKYQKIYICNEKSVEFSKKMLNIDNHVVIHKSKWYENDYQNILNKCVNAVVDVNKIMFLISGGIGAKVLISDLHKKYNNAIIIDLGSALHYLFTGDKIRLFDDYYQYDEIKTYFKELL